MARKYPRWSYRALIANTPGVVSRSTIRRILQSYDLRKWKAKKRIPLNPDVAKKRLDWCRNWATFTRWEDMIFSDECSVQRGSNSPVQFVFRFQDEAFRQDLVNLESHGRDISQMIWGAIWIGGRSELVVMERDQDAPRQGYSSVSYIDALNNALLDIYEPGILFQQDNAGIHTSEHTQEWFETHGIYVIDWPPHSPDLNPIEVVWALLKRELFNRYPSIANGRRRIRDWEVFREALIDSWNHIDQDVIDSLIRSMPRRIDAVKKARGWYTKY